MILFGIVMVIIVVGAVLLLLWTRQSRLQRQHPEQMESKEQRQRNEQLRKSMENKTDYPNRNFPGPWR